MGGDGDAPKVCKDSGASGSFIKTQSRPGKRRGTSVSKTFSVSQSPPGPKQAEGSKLHALNVARFPLHQG